MANVRLTWSLPTVRASTKPLNPADIAGLELAVSADGGANFTVTDALVPPTQLETQYLDMDIGTWVFRGVVIDKAGRRGKPKNVTVVVPDETPPGELVTFEAVLF